MTPLPNGDKEKVFAAVPFEDATAPIEDVTPSVVLKAAAPELVER